MEASDSCDGYPLCGVLMLITVSSAKSNAKLLRSHDVWHRFLNEDLLTEKMK